MDSLTVDHTYGQALFDAANEQGKINEIMEEYKAVSEVFKNNPQLKRLFLIPTVSALMKREVAKNVFEGRISKELLNYIYVLIDKRRVGAFDDIRRHYDKLVRENDGMIKGLIYSALPMDEDRIEAFEEKIGATLEKKVSLANRIDKSLIGGVRIYIDGKLYDASVKTRLENIRQRIKI